MHTMNCCFFIPIKTGVYLITAIGLLNRLSGFYGVISLDYSDPIIYGIHLYLLLSLGGFVMGLFGIHNDEYKLIRQFMLFYWFDFVITTMTTIYLSIQWFVYTDHSLPNLSQELQQRHEIEFKSESILSIIILSILRVAHFYFAYILTTYYKSNNRIQYIKLIDEEKQSNSSL